MPSIAAQNAAIATATADYPYLSLHTADPGQNGANEVSGGGYARLIEGFTVPSGGSATNTTALTANVNAGTVISFVGHWTAATGGTFGFGGPISPPQTSVGTITLGAGSDVVTGGSLGATPNGSSSVLVASSTSTPGVKATADFVCTGIADDVTINTAIASIPANTGGKVVLATGLYYLANPVIIDQSFISLEGQSHPMWGAFYHAWTGTGNTGMVGTAGSSLQATVSGFDLVQIANTHTPDNGESRHRGIRVAHLYLVGVNYLNAGISDGGIQHDSCVFEDNFIHRTLQGINVTGDAARICGNNIQDIGGDAITLGGYLGGIDHNLVYDIGGNGITLNNIQGTVVDANRVGDCVIGAYLNGATQFSLSGNRLAGTQGIVTSDGGSGAITGGSVVGAGTADAVAIGQTGHPTYTTAVTGVVVKLGGTSSPSGAYAIAYRGGSAYGSVSGCVVDGAWNAASTSTMLAGTNVRAANAGDDGTH